MAVIVHQQFSKLVVDYVLGNSGSVLPPSTWTMSLNTTTVGTMARDSIYSPTITGTNINEIASSTLAGYGRPSIARTIGAGGVDWVASTFDNTTSTGGQSAAADQVTFSFTGAPSPNGATSWTISEGTTLNAGNRHMSGDLAATRTFANGDTEKVTATVKAG